MKNKQLALGGFIFFLILLYNGYKFVEKKDLSEEIAINIDEINSEEYTLGNSLENQELLSNDSDQYELICNELKVYEEKVLEYSELASTIWYTIDDLNHNNRLELILAIHNGTALYTEFTIYEVNETLDGIEQYELSNNNSYMCEIVSGEEIIDSLPDIITEKVEWNKNLETTQYEYYFIDKLRVGPEEYYLGYYRVWFDKNLLYQRLIAYRYIRYSSDAIAEEFFYDENGNELTEKQFHDLGFFVTSKNEKELNWKEYNEGILLNEW